MRALAPVLVLVPLIALGGWRQANLNGTGHDVHVVDAGLFIAITNVGAELKHCPLDAGTCFEVGVLTTGGLLGASIGDGGCLWSVGAGGVLGGSCGFTGTIGSSLAPQRLRCMGSGQCGVTGQDMTNLRLYTAASPGNAPLWRSGMGFGNSQTGSLLNSLTGVSVGGVDYLLHVANGPGFTLIVDGGAVTANQTIPGTLPQPTDGVLFSRPDGGLGLIAILRDTAAVRERYGADVTYNGAYVDAGWRPDPIAFDPEIGGLRLITYTELGGSAFGHGFGIGTQRDGGVLLAGAVPNPGAPGMYWVPRAGGPGQLPVGQQLRALSCIDPRFCVALTNGNIAYAYWNTGGVVGGSIGGATAVVEGGAAQVFLQGSDRDGDPYWVTWLYDGGVLQPVVNGDAGAVSRFATVTAQPNPGAPCQQLLPVQAIVSDGWAPHDVIVDGGLLVLRSSPDPAVVTPSNVRVDAGGSPVILVAAAMGCTGTLTWSLGGDAGTLVSTGASATYTPPSHLCVADGGSVTIAVSSQLDGGASVAGNAATIEIAPWGAPNTPGWGAGAFTQPAGTVQTYAFVGQSHVCQAATDFPGVTARLLDAGAPATVTVMVGSGGVTVVSTDECVGGAVNPLVAFELNGATSQPGDFDVTVVPNTGPLFNPQFSMNLDAGPVTTGVFTVDAGCLAQRGLSGEVVISGAASETSGRVAVPGPWSVTLRGGCSGGTYTATATLFQDGGAIGVEAAQFSLSPRPAAIGELDRELPVSCDGVDSPLSLGEAGGCPLAATVVTWTQDAGPALEPLSSAPTVQVRSVERGLDGLIGATLVFDIEVNAGGGNVARASRSVRLVPARFVRVQHSFSPVVANRDDVVTVSATVHNTGSCRVGGVMLEETPTGLRYISGSARVDGEAVDASGAPSVGPFALEAGQTRTVTWLAKVPLLSTPRARGAAYVAGLPISEPEEEPVAPVGCGCSSAPLVWLGVAVVAVFKRRTRRR